MDSLAQSHVLILDPDVSTRVLLEAVLQRRGLRVTACSNEDDAAAQALQRGRYSIVIISSDMRGFVMLLDLLHMTPPGSRPKIVVATTSEIALPPARADLVLVKPFHLTELHNAIAACCSPPAEDRIHLRSDSLRRARESAAEVR